VPPFRLTALLAAPRRLLRVCVLALAWATAPAQALDQVTIQLKWSHQFQFAGFYAAQAKGYYKEAGLEVNLLELPRDVNPADPVLNGNAQYGVHNTKLLVERAHGKPVVVLATLFQHSPAVLLVRHDERAHPVPLKDGVLMFYPDNIEIPAFLRRIHAEPYRRVDPSNNPEDLVNGRVDAMASYVTDNPFKLEREHVGFSTISPRSAGIDFYGDLLYTTEAELSAHPRRAAAVREATLRGFVYAMAHPDEIADLIRARYPQRATRAELMYEAEHMAPLMELEVVEPGYINPARWRAIADQYVAFGQVPANMSLEGFLYRPPSRDLSTVYAILAAASALLLVVGGVAWRFARLTASLRAERAALRETEERLSGTENLWGLALENAGEGMWHWDRGSGRLTLSARYKELLGYGPNEFEIDYNEWTRHLHPDDRPQFEHDLADFLRRSEPGDNRGFALEFRLRCKDGRYKWMMGRGLVIARDGKRRPARLAGGLADISARKEAEEARVRAVLEASPEAMLVIDAGGRIRNANQLCASSFGYGLEELDGMQAARLAPGVQAAQEANHVLSAYRKDGTRFWAHVVVDAIRDEAGQLLGFAKITRDITEKRRAAEELEQAREALFQSQKLEAIGQLTGGIAHDFNNLLAVVSSGLDVIGAQGGQVDRRVVDSMRRAIERGSSLTQQLLSFARQQPLSPQPHRLNQLIAGFESVLRRATTKDIALEIELQATQDAVLVDEARFEASLLNLVVNARDAMPDGGLIRICTADAELGARAVGALPAGRYVRVSVRDNGSGMSAATRARAFEPFYTTKPVGKGTGLGLSQVQGFIAQSGGEVTLDSETGRGTAIHLFLPLQEAAPAVAARRDDGEKVLIVEDEPDLMHLASELFRSMGYDVYSAANGEDALQVLERTPGIDVLFSDVVMPGMSGVELARLARQRYPATRVVLASGYPIPALRAQQSDIDEFPYVSKPYRLSEILKRLR